MNSHNEPFYEQIDLFLSGQLPPEQVEHLKNALLNDPALAQAVAVRRLEFEVSESLIAANIREHLQRLQTPTEASSPDPSNRPSLPNASLNRPWLIWGALAILLFFMIAGFYVWRRSVPITPSDAPVIPPIDQPIPQANNNAPRSPDQSKTVADIPQKTSPQAPNIRPQKPVSEPRQLALARSYYKTPDMETLRGPSTPARADSVLKNAMDAWEKQDYAAVVKGLQDFPTTDPQFIRVLTLRAHAQFQLKQFHAAAQAFTSITDSKIMPWSEEAEWYLLLALLADGRSGTANFRNQMAKILSDKGHPYVEQAGNLYKSI